MPSRIYSVGYEGLEVRTLVEHLTAAGVALLVDVRLHPVSRRRGWSKGSLRAELEAAGIAYRHEPALGNPSDNREAFRRGDGEEGRRRMRQLLEEGAGTTLHRLADDARRRPIAVLCVERAAPRCHRQVITDMVRETDPGIEVVPLR